MNDMLRVISKFVHQSWLIVSFCIGIIFGVVVGLIFRINYFASWRWIGLVLIVLVISYLKPRMAFVGICFVMGMVLTFFRIARELDGENYIRQFYGKTVVVTGAVDGDPDTDESGTIFKLSSLQFGDEKIKSAGSLYISIGKNDELARGDEITIEGKLSEGFGIYSGYFYRPKIMKWSRPEPGDLILMIRNWFAERAKRLIPEPEVNLGLSYLMGMKSGLPEDLSESLRMVGLTHIVVASGAHLSILVEIARKIFGRISRFAGLMFSVLFILFFMSMVGWTPSILRAGVMAILTLVGWYVGRKITPWRIILLVAAFTLMLNPMFIINLGWLLSFASYGGIMILGPKLTKYFYGEKKPGLIASTVITTIAATVMTLPITLYYFGMISLISVVANLLILPTLPYAMGLVFLTGVMAGLPGIGVVISWCATKILDFHIVVVKFFGSMEQFVIKIEPYQIWASIIYGLVGLLMMLFWLKRLWYNKKHE